MPVTGKLVADFESFYAAAQKAEVSLRSFESGAGKVESALNRMTGSFSGQKVIQDATLMTTAVEKIGGISQLTENELKAVSARAAEATEKMKKLGIEVPPGLQNIADASKDVGSGFQSILKFLGPIGPAIAGAFSFGAVVAFGRQIFESADSLVKLSDQTGIGVEALQELREAAAESGNSLDEVAHAVNQMQRRIAGGDDTAVAALAELNVSLASIREQAPEQQFYAIGKAIAAVQDPAERARLAIAVFGRSGAEILPTLRADLQGIADGTEKMSDATVKAIDRAGDAWTRLKNNLAAAAGTIIGKIAEIEAPILKGMEDAKRANDLLELGLKQTADMGPLLDLVKKPVLEVGAAFKWVPPTSTDLIDLNFQLDVARERMNRETVEANKATEAHRRFTDSIKNLTTDAIGAAKGFGMLGQTMIVGGQTLGDVRNQLDQLDASVMAFHDGISIAGDTLSTVVIPAFSMLPNVIPEGTKALEDARVETDRWVATMAKLPDVLSQAFTGGGGFSGALKAFANDISKALFGKGGAFEGISQGLGDAVAGAMSFLGKGVSGALGKVFAGLLPGLGGIITGIGALFGKLFNNPEKQINPIREAFVQAAGGLDLLNKRAHAAGVTLTALLDAKNPKAYQKAIEDLNAAFQFQDQSMQFLDDTVKKYGFSLSELGPTLANQKLGEQAAQIEKEWYALAGAGVDLNQISIHMGKSVSEWLQQSLKAGTEIPDSMREILHQLAAVGLLTDENGNKYDLAAVDALNYTKSTAKAMEDLAKVIQDLTDAITRGLGGALKGVADEASKVHIPAPEAPAGTGPDGLPNGAMFGGMVTPLGIQHFGRGGTVLPFRPRGTDTVPAMLTPGEMVLTAAQQRGLLSGRSPVVINVTVQGSVIAERDLATLVQRHQDAALRLRRKFGAA